MSLAFEVPVVGEKIIIEFTRVRDLLGNITSTVKLFERLGTPGLNYQIEELIWTQ